MLANYWIKIYSYLNRSPVRPGRSGEILRNRSLKHHIHKYLIFSCSILVLELVDIYNYGLLARLAPDRPESQEY